MDPLELLLREWEKNVDLYIDQDQRAQGRMTTFFVIQAGMLAGYGAALSQIPRDCHFLLAISAILLPAIAVYFTECTRSMSRRAHAFILLRKTQGMLIEKKMKELVASGSNWETASGIITTFTREHVAFIGRDKIDEPAWEKLKSEIADSLGRFAFSPFEPSLGEWHRSMGHLKWLNRTFWILDALWILVAVVTLLAILRICIHIEHSSINIIIGF